MGTNPLIVAGYDSGTDEQTEPVLEPGTSSAVGAKESREQSSDEEEHLTSAAEAFSQMRQKDLVHLNKRVRGTSRSRSSSRKRLRSPSSGCSSVSSEASEDSASRFHHLPSPPASSSCFWTPGSVPQPQRGSSTWYDRVPTAGKAVGPASEIAQGPPELLLTKRAVLESLTQIKSQPPGQWRRAFKKLLREWHPDKNLHQTDIATPIFQFLQEKRKQFLG